MTGGTSMWSTKISRMIIACALLLAGLSVSALSTAVAQEPLGAPIAAGTYDDPVARDLPYVPGEQAPKAPATLTPSSTAAEGTSAAAGDRP
jgi:hypothetical protein